MKAEEVVAVPAHPSRVLRGIGRRAIVLLAITSMLGIAAILIVAAAAFYVVWVFTLCGDCSGPATLPPPPA